MGTGVLRSPPRVQDLERSLGSASNSILICYCCFGLNVNSPLNSLFSTFFKVRSPSPILNFSQPQPVSFFSLAHERL